jgi:hypothetical protein
MASLKINLLLLSIAPALLSCSRFNNTRSVGQFSKTTTYKINGYAGCCGCFARYFNIYEGKKIEEQVIYNYNCYSPGLPTKFVFNYAKNGNLVDCDKYIATSSNDIELELTSYEKRLFILLDTDTSLHAANTNIKYAEIKGFRKPKEKEVTHSFPLVKKGYKLRAK